MAATWDQLLDPESLNELGDTLPSNKGQHYHQHQHQQHQGDGHSQQPYSDTHWDPEVIFGAPNALPSSFLASFEGGGFGLGFLPGEDVVSDPFLPSGDAPVGDPFLPGGSTSPSSLLLQETDRDYFLPQGAFRPPWPCDYCRRLRLNCFLLQSTIVNPNPLQSCSSCVALYRQCSFAERPKRRPHEYETRDPVIGPLHGVPEEGPVPAPDALYEDENMHRAMDVSEGAFPLDGDGRAEESSQLEASSFQETGRRTTRSVRKTRALRNWMHCHLDDPYPSETEKLALAEESGLNMTQVNNWFANARRRQKHLTRARSETRSSYRQGSPMPRNRSSELTPLDRWRNSPPDLEPASRDAIERALRRESNSSMGSLASVGFSRSHSRRRSHTRGRSSGRASSISGASESSANSFSRYGSSNSDAVSYTSDGNTATVESPTKAPSKAPKPRPRLSRGSKVVTYICTFCTQSFKKKYDWLRHERSVHMPSLSLYICSPPLLPDQSAVVYPIRPSSSAPPTQPLCLYCGCESPNESHLLSHEFATCLDKAPSERTFTRKDHLWQHMEKFHGCRKWDGWDREGVEKVCRRVRDKVSSKCGFCGLSMTSWGHRAEHLAGHFKDGSGMQDWEGGCGVEELGEEEDEGMCALDT